MKFQKFSAVLQGRSDGLRTIDEVKGGSKRFKEQGPLCEGATGEIALEIDHFVGSNVDCLTKPQGAEPRKPFELVMNRFVVLQVVAMIDVSNAFNETLCSCCWIAQTMELNDRAG